MSKSFVIRYQMRPDTTEENKALIERVFTELAEKQPEGVRYAAFRLEDGITFVHVGTVPDEDNPLVELPAFQEFAKAFGDRTATEPDRASGEIIGAYGLDLTPEQ